ncbi:MAG: GTP-binding protein [Candidatus Heimdallarchaeota archaeon]
MVSSELLSSYAKVVLWGSRKVGKTSLLRRLLNLPPSDKYLPTIGVRIHNLEAHINENHYYLQFWDVSGNEIYHDLLPSLVKNTGCMVLVFDHQNKKSQEEVMELYEKVRELAESVPILIVGNKAEETKKEVPKRMENWARARNLRILPMSAKHGLGASLLLNMIVKACGIPINRNE